MLVRYLPAALALALVAAFLAFSPPSSTRAATQPVTLWLPWEGGALWTYTQGPHGDSAEGLDFQPPDAAGKPCELFTSAFWVVAAADGTVSAVKPNVIEVDHGNGFATGYFHLENRQVKLGDRVAAGERLGTPGCCPDGPVDGCWSTAPHLHFYTTYNGARQPAEGLNLGGWRVGPDGCMYRAGQVSCPLESGGGRIVSNSPRQGQNSPSTQADIAVVIDTSRNMSEHGGPTRTEAALALLQATRPDDRISIIEFNSSARVLSPLAQAAEGDAVSPDLVAAVETMETGGRTNVRLGLVTACAQLLANGSAPAKAVILLSDGKHNKGSFSGAAECLQEAGIPVFSYAPGRGNLSLLSGLAEKTGGEFRRLSEIENLYCEFLRVRTVLSGDPPGSCTTLQLKQGDSISMPFSIPADQDQALLEVRWRERRTSEEAAAQGVPVNTRILGPSGTPLSVPFPGVGVEEHEGAVVYRIAYPQEGTWTLVVSATELIPAEGIFVTFSASTVPQVPPSFFEDNPPPGTPDVLAETETPAPTESPSPTATPRPTRTIRTPWPTAEPTPSNPAPTETAVPSPTETLVPDVSPADPPSPAPG